LVKVCHLQAYSDLVSEEFVEESVITSRNTQ